MADEDVNVRFGGSIEGLTGAVKEGAEKIGELVSPISDVTKALGEMSEAWAAAFAVEKILSMAEAAEEWGDKLHKASEETGMSVENLSALNVAADHADVGFDTLQRGIAHFAESMSQAESGTGRQAAAFKALGISQDELKAHGDDTAGMMELVAKRLDQFGDGANKQALVMELFGARLRDIQPVLNDLAENGFEGLRAKAAEVGLLFDGEFAESMDKAHKASKDFEETSHALSIELGAHLLPVLTEIEKVLARLFGSHIGDADIAANEKKQLADLEAELARLKEQSSSNSNIFEGMFNTVQIGHVQGLIELMKRDIDALTPESEKLAEAFKNMNLGSPLQVKETEQFKKPEAPSIGDGQSGSSGPGEVQVWRDQLDQKLMAERNFFKDSQAEELAFWQSKVGLTQQGSQEQLEVERTIYSLEKAMAQEQRQQNDEIARADADMSLEVAKLKLAQQKAQLDSEVAAGQVSATQKIALEKALVEQEYQLEIQAAQQRLALLNDQPAQYKQVYDQIVILKQKEAADLAAIDRKSADDQIAEQKRADQEIAASGAQTITGLITGRETWGKAADDVADKVLEYFIKKGLEEVAQEVGIEQMKTAAEQSGALGRGLAWMLGDSDKLASGASGAAGAAGSVTGAGGTAAQTTALTANTTAMTTLSTQLAALDAALGGHEATLGVNTVATTTNSGATLTGAAATTTGAVAATGNTVATAANTGTQSAGILAWIGNTAATIANTIATDAEAIGSFLGFADGTDSLPFTGPIIAHEGERIVPAAINRQINDGSIMLGKGGGWGLPDEMMAHGDSRSASRMPNISTSTHQLFQGGAGGDTHNHYHVPINASTMGKLSAKDIDGLGDAVKGELKTAHRLGHFSTSRI